MSFSIADLFTEHFTEKFDLHEHHLNNQMVRVLRTIGYDRNYKKAIGQYLYDEDGNEYLDLLSGFGVFAMGRNHPTIIKALQETLTLELPNLVQMDVSLLSGLLAKEILATCPDNLEKMFFCNSGTEAVEAAIKFARYTTKRPRIVHCDHSYHGLTMGSLSLTGEEIFREGFGPLLPQVSSVPFNDLEAVKTWRPSLSNRFKVKASTFPPTTICRRSNVCVKNTVRCLWLTKFKPASAALANSGQLNTGASNPT
jgi:ornithine--oxo-acid transaminase